MSRHTHWDWTKPALSESEFLSQVEDAFPNLKGQFGMHRSTTCYQARSPDDLVSVTYWFREAHGNNWSINYFFKDLPSFGSGASGPDLKQAIAVANHNFKHRVSHVKAAQKTLEGVLGVSLEEDKG